MRSLILDRVSFGYAGGHEILHDVSLVFQAGWTGIVGDNGAGKSTLLGIASGGLRPTCGHVLRTHLTSIEVVDQRVDTPGASILAFAASHDREVARWRARFSLDVSEVERWETLSPGERKRWQLAAALARDPDMLIVDEPTTHLDAEALASCVAALEDFQGVGLIVSHDRDLLERLTDQTIRVHDGTARGWPGAYAAARTAWELELQLAHVRRAELSACRRRAERQLGDARRREHAASSAISAGSRMKNRSDSDARSIGRKNLASWAAAAAGREVERAHTRLDAARSAEQGIQLERVRGAAVEIGWEPAARRWLVQLDRAELRAGTHVIARNLHLAIARDQRIWLRGANGAGKTTLLAALAEHCTLPPDRLFVLPQDLGAEASASLARSIGALDRAARGRLGQLADALGLDPDRAVRSEAPSPGETRKLALALGLTRRPWLVLLDEPTNHLDLPSIERLEPAFAAYPGALLVISHDRQLAARLCTSTWTLEAGRVTVT